MDYLNVKKKRNRIQAIDARKIICMAGVLLIFMLMLSACGSEKVQPAENGRQVLINTDEISVAATDYQSDNLNRKAVQFEVANKTDNQVEFFITGAKLDGKNIHYDAAVGIVEANTETEISWELYGVDLYDYDKNLFPDLKSFEISLAVRDADHKDIASAKNVSLDFNNLGNSN